MKKKKPNSRTNSKIFVESDYENVFFFFLENDVPRRLDPILTIKNK